MYLLSHKSQIKIKPELKLMAPDIADLPFWHNCHLGIFHTSVFFKLYYHIKDQ